MTSYEQGFLTKCAEYGVDGRPLLKSAAVSWNPMNWLRDTYKNPDIGYGVNWGDFWGPFKHEYGKAIRSNVTNFPHSFADMAGYMRGSIGNGLRVAGGFGKGLVEGLGDIGRNMRDTFYKSWQQQDPIGYSNPKAKRPSSPSYPPSYTTP